MPLVSLFAWAVMTPHLLPVNSWQLSGTQAQLVTFGEGQIKDGHIWKAPETLLLF